jgi:hypothetical protein
MVGGGVGFSWALWEWMLPLFLEMESDDFLEFSDQKYHTLMTFNFWSTGRIFKLQKSKTLKISSSIHWTWSISGSNWKSSKFWVFYFFEVWKSIQWIKSKRPSKFGTFGSRSIKMSWIWFQICFQKYFLCLQQKCNGHLNIILKYIKNPDLLLKIFFVCSKNAMDMSTLFWSISKMQWICQHYFEVYQKDFLNKFNVCLFWCICHKSIGKSRWDFGVDVKIYMSLFLSK